MESYLVFQIFKDKFVVLIVVRRLLVDYCGGLIAMVVKKAEGLLKAILTKSPDLKNIWSENLFQ